MEHNYYLAHHGVKGQKWGIRKKTQRLNRKHKVKKYSQLTSEEKRKIRKTVLKYVGISAATGVAGKFAEFGSGYLLSGKNASPETIAKARKAVNVAVNAAMAAQAGLAIKEINNIRRVNKKK